MLRLAFLFQCTETLELQLILVGIMECQVRIDDAQESCFRVQDGLYRYPLHLFCSRGSRFGQLMYPVIDGHGFNQRQIAELFAPGSFARIARPAESRAPDRGEIGEGLLQDRQLISFIGHTILFHIARDFLQADKIEFSAGLDIFDGSV